MYGGKCRWGLGGTLTKYPGKVESSQPVRAVALLLTYINGEEGNGREPIMFIIRKI